MTLQVLLKSGGLKVDLPASISSLDAKISPATASAKINFNSNGTITDHNGTPLGSWLIGAPHATSVGALFEVFWTIGTGTLDIGTAGAWESLSGGYTFGVGRSGIGSNRATGTLSVREIANTSNTDSCPADVEAEVSI